jgi:hypothetical protein
MTQILSSQTLEAHISQSGDSQIVPNHQIPISKQSRPLKMLAQPPTREPGDNSVGGIRGTFMLE